MIDFYQPLTAFISVGTLFAGSHFLWVRQKRKNEGNSFPLFFGRLFVIIPMLYCFSRWTNWSMESFTLWVITFYLLFLGGHTWYMYHLLGKKADENINEKTL